ncbi:pectate lyase family protein [Fontivita pretiosa]|uniref:pectate lyase family protein n=1 Tax=Fontivita pretiosa TaxID=2989684 RepID=UPI003D171A5B
MIRSPLCIAVALSMLLTATDFTTGQTTGQQPSPPAFPGAEGPGSDATGGRGGDVYHVTSLIDDANQPGTLRHGIKTAPPAGRIIVFDVGGIIRLQPPGRAGWLDVSQSNLTIAGQTAPGPGITIIGQASKWTGSNVILRNLKFRPGKDQQSPGVRTNDGITSYLRNSIIDHVSVTWADDEAISVTDDANNTTVQYCLMAEGLNYKGHSYGSLISSDHDDALVSFHHNLYAHNKSRLPRLGSEKGSGVILNFSNNVIYDWSGKGGYSANDVNSRKPLPNRTNFIGNYYVMGPSNRPDDSAFDGANAETVIYQRDNLLDRNRNGKFDGEDLGWAMFAGTFTRANKPFDVPAGYIQPASEALEHVLNHAGAFWWDRDPIDSRIVQQVRTQTGRIINEVDDVGGFPAFEPVSRPKGFDTDHDGMPDTWESDHGLDPNTPDDKGDFDRDGYTNIEEYINELAAFPAPRPLEMRVSEGRYELAANWELRWQPSRYDQVLLRRGNVTVDSVGQHAGTLNIDRDASLAILSGWLQVQRNLVNAGQLQIAGGQLRSKGDLELSPAGTLTVKLNPDSPTPIVVANHARLAGGLFIELPADDRPQSGQRFQILQAGQISGSFSTVSKLFELNVAEGKVVAIVK